MVSGEIFHLALHSIFSGSKWPFSATRCKHHRIFRKPLRAVAGTPAHLFGPTLAGCTAKGGVSTSTTCSVAVIEVHQPQNFGLLTSNLHLRHIDARTFGVLFKTLHVSVSLCAITYMLCAIGQCGLLGFPFRTSTSPPTTVTCEGRGYSGIREDKVKCQPPSNWQSPSRGLAVSTSGVEITK